MERKFKFDVWMTTPDVVGPQVLVFGDKEVVPFGERRAMSHVVLPFELSDKEFAMWHPVFRAIGEVLMGRDGEDYRIVG